MNVFDEMGNYWAEIAEQNSTQTQTQFIKNTLKGNGLILEKKETAKSMVSY
jgi:hypothetical protein